MDRIESESARMGLLVEDLLILARMDAQRPLELRPVDLLELAGEAVHNARALAAQKGTPDRAIELQLGDAPEDADWGGFEILGDRARLQQVLANLIGNALTHTPADAKVTVRLIPDVDIVRLEVADTGPGLPPDAADRVFERFYRTDKSRTRASGGTGLGLSIVASLVEAHGGRVWAESTPDHGATFIVVLPRVRV
jgi:two-component system OmpR family sensor kinase